MRNATNSFGYHRAVRMFSSDGQLESDGEAMQQVCDEGSGAAIFAKM